MNYKYKIGETALLNRNPLDEQLGEFISLGNKMIVDIMDVSHIEGTSGQWVKIKEYHDWIDSTWFKPLI